MVRRRDRIFVVSQHALGIAERIGGEKNGDGIDAVVRWAALVDVAREQGSLQPSPHFCGIFDCSSLARFGTVTFSNAQYYCASGSHCSPQGQSGEVGLHGDIDTNFKVTINECGCQSGGVLNVDTGLISSQSFTETWLTSQGT